MYTCKQEYMYSFPTSMMMFLPFTRAMPSLGSATSPDTYSYS